MERVSLSDDVQVLVEQLRSQHSQLDARLHELEHHISLTAEEQQVHFRAQRFARVRVAEMRLYEGDAVLSGRAKRNLYEALRKPIDSERKTFHDSFYTACLSMVDYLHLEMVRTLANDDPELLGKDYPGPLA